MKDLKEVSSEDLRSELELRGYYTNNLWHVEDVFDTCEDIKESEVAQEILDKVMQSEWTMEFIRDCIRERCVGYYFTNK